MRVLFAYYSREHAAPLLRCADQFPVYGAVLLSAQYTNQSELLARLQQADYDVLLLEEPPLYPEALDCGKPVVLLERIDGTQLRACRSVLSRVAGVLKGYVLRDRQDYNRYYDRPFIETLQATGPLAPRPRACADLPQPQLTTAELNKIGVSYGFGSWDILRRYVATYVDFDAERPYDVSFVGTVQYQGNEIEVHRQCALMAADAWARARPGRAVALAGRPYNDDEYAVTMLRSKTVLSPWGWGESTYRDYQAMALGAIVIKPDTDRVECWPQIYHGNVTYMVCRPDFADAGERIAAVAERWTTYCYLRIQVRNIVLTAWATAELAQRIVGYLQVFTGLQ